MQDDIKIIYRGNTLRVPIDYRPYEPDDEDEKPEPIDQEDDLDYALMSLNERTFTPITRKRFRRVRWLFKSMKNAALTLAGVIVITVVAIEAMWLSLRAVAWLWYAIGREDWAAHWAATWAWLQGAAHFVAVWAGLIWTDLQHFIHHVWNILA